MNLMSMEDQNTQHNRNGFFTDFSLDTEVYGNIMPKMIFFITKEGFKMEPMRKRF